MDFYSRIDTHVGEIPSFVKYALVLMDYKTPQDFRNLQEIEMPRFFEELDAKIISIALENTPAAYHIVEKANDHIEENDMNADTYHLPQEVREKINKIRVIYKEDPSKRKTPEEMLDQVKEKVKSHVIKSIPEDVVNGWPDLTFKIRNERIYSSCPECGTETLVWSHLLQNRTYRFINHLKKHLGNTD